MVDRNVPIKLARSSAVFVLASVSFAAAVFFTIASGHAQSGPTPVILSKVGVDTISDRIEALGTLRANESISVSSQVTEVITRIRFDDGQRVKDGDVLAEMTSAEERAQLKEAEALVREAREQLNRVSPLAKKGISSGQQLSERRRDFDAASARLEAVQSRIADRLIKAPFSGVIGLRTISVGALVEPGTVIATIDDDSKMKLDFTIPATYLPTIKIGLPIIARANAFGNREFNGKVTSIDSRIDPVTRAIVLRAVIPNPDGVLRAGALMTVQVFKDQREAVVVPEQSVIARGQKSSVFVVDPDAVEPVATKRDVALGSRQDGFVEVTKGIKVGEYVVTDGTVRITPDSPVKIVAIEQGREPLNALLKQKNDSAKDEPAGSERANF